MAKRLQRFVQLGRTNRKVTRTSERYQRQSSNGARRQCRTRLTFRRPDSSSAWNTLYGGGNGHGNGHGNGNLNLSVEYNHGDVGITDPSLQSLHFNDGDDDNNDADYNDYIDDDGNNNFNIDYFHNQQEVLRPFDQAAVDINTSANKELAIKQNEGSWWPSSSYDPKTHRQRRQLQPKSKSKNDRDGGTEGWRILRYTRRVGRGDECYQRVRNAALDWEFHKDGRRGDDRGGGDEGGIDNRRDGRGKNAMGMLRAVPPSLTQQAQDQNSDNTNDPFAPLPPNTNTNVVQIWSSPGRRRLVTYAESKLSIHIGSRAFRFHCSSPSLYVLNPVAVVYDLIDQRGPGTTYTSTAYGTLGGHWLRGEERVTVALRDCESGAQDGRKATSSHRRRDIRNGGYVDVEILSYSRPSSSFMGRLVWPVIGKMQNAFFLNQLDALEDIAQEHG